MDFEDTGGPIFPHTVLVFIPGNPGLVDWYLRSFETILMRLGPGFAARGVANAGHAFEDGLSTVATKDDKNDDATKAAAIAHTVDGQSIHKCAYVDLLTVEFDEWRTSTTQTETVGRPPLPTWIFVSHSIGCHFIQRALILRPDVIRRTRLLIHLTPFLRMSAPAPTQRLLDWAASNGPTVIAGSTSFLKILKQLHRSLLNEMFKPAIGDASSREITVSLLQQPRMAANFFHLGTQEIRDVPQLFDLSAMKYIARHCHTSLLVAGDDRWFPQFQVHQLKDLIDKKVVRNHSVYFDRTLKHGYVLDPESSERIVVDFCVDRILDVAVGRARL